MNFENGVHFISREKLLKELNKNGISLRELSRRIGKDISTISIAMRSEKPLSTGIVTGIVKHANLNPYAILSDEVIELVLSHNGIDLSTKRLILS